MEQSENNIVTLFSDRDERLIFPCSTTQNSFWFFDQLNPGNSTFNIDTCWEVQGAITSDMVEQAFQKIIDRHEILRTRIIECDGVPMQEVLETEFKLDIVDMTHVDASELYNRFEDLLYETSHTPHDTSKLPTVVGQFIKAGEDHAIIACYIHHAFFDGGSMGIFGKELETIFVAMVEEHEPKLPELPLQFGDYALWQQEYLACKKLEQETQYWKTQLADLPYFEVAPDHPRDSSRRLDGYLRFIDLSPDFCKQLEAAANKNDTTMFGYGAAIGMTLLHCLTGERDIVVTTQVSERNAEELENMIGGFINSLVLRFDLSGDPTFLDFSTRASKTIVEALIHQQMPFSTLNELINPSRDRNRAPITSVNFESAITSESTQNLQHDKFSLKSLPFASTGTIYDLNFVMIDWQDSWRMGIEYNPDLFDAKTIDDFLAYWKQVMEIAVYNPQIRLSEIPIKKRTFGTANTHSYEPNQITRFLEQHPAVSSAITVQNDNNEDGHSAPYAYVTPSTDHYQPLETLPSSLMLDLDKSLSPEDMPLGISVLARFPCRTNGDIDLDLLPSPSLVTAPSRQPAITTKNTEPSTSSNDVLQILGPIWKEVLGVNKVEPDVSFFDQGGHSMLAARMLSRVRKTFDQSNVNVATLFEAPTLNLFARHLMSLEEPQKDVPVLTTHEAHQLEWEVIKVQPKGSLTPIIGINQSMLYHTLSQRIGDERPFIDVQIKGDNILSGQPPDLSFEEIASGCLRQIRSFRPHGPYILFGHCVNGHIAFEVAQQLRRDGEEITLLAMVDSGAPGYIESLSPVLFKRWQLAYKYAKLRYTVHQYLTTDMGFKEVFLKKMGILRKAANKLPGERFSLQLTREELIDQKLSSYLMAAREGYQALSYEGMVINFITEEVPKMRNVDSELGWGCLLTGHFTMPHLTGWHQDIFRDPSATLMANHMQRMLKLEQKKS